MGRLDERVAVATGAARGMGASHARCLIAEGARNVLTDILVDEGTALADELGQNALFMTHDVTSPADWDCAIATAEEAYGPIDMLVNNAGVAAYAPIATCTEDDYRRIIDVNQVSVFLGMKAASCSMSKGGGGSIVNISSVAGLIGEANTVAYTASKFAVHAMTKVAAKEFGPHGIRVNSIHPGVIETPMITDTPQAGAVIEAVAASAPLRRIGQPREVSNLVVFLASEESSFTTGAAFVVDGGVLR
ncbi:glucose 1-dehydrogenase [Rhodococcus sp. NM-2]|uniref:glucose 1-dehydrogenase n=1 Tax=Rhodococcus sp. NM-2 TaxID=3401174 RepID=UPI003AAD6065